MMAAGMTTRRLLVLYGLAVGTLALMLSWWVVFFVRQGAVLVERVERSGASLSAAQAEAVRDAAHQSLRMFLFEGAFLFALFVAGVVLVLRAMRREVVLARTQREFLSAVTHELRTPLASARLALQSLELGRVSPEKRARYLANAQADLARLSELVERVLESSRVATGRARLALERLDLVEFVAARAPALASEVAPGLALELARGEPTPVEADARALETILRNLLANAAKYAAEAGRVELAVTRDARQACLRVRDFGPGTSGDPARLFEPFARGDGPLVKSRPGVGLGLYLVAELARALGGTVSARNASAGGFEVALTLPLAEPAPGAG
jgi:signal transduction histidine kinase